MTQVTSYKRSLSRSIGAGMRSVVGDKGRRYYILEHKVSSKYHRAGESQRIIVDEIEIGRDARCQVRFDEQFTTVSRRHAAIIRVGDNWKLVQLSQTNSTYLNGRKVVDEWYLQNGDEIQLSANGPKLGFIVPAGDKGLVRSIGMTARLNLFRQQALRPYKTALTALALFLLLCCGVGTFFLVRQRQEINAQAALIAENEKRHNEEMATQDSLLAAAKIDQEKLTSELARVKSQLGKVSQQQREIAVATGSINNDALSTCLPNVYFILSQSIDIVLPDGSSATINCFDEETPVAWCGTGFLLDDGTFVTARHVVEPWYYSSEDEMLVLNAVANNGGKVRVNFVAYSSSGEHLSLSSSSFSVDRSQDRRRIEDGVKLSMGSSASDIATTKVGRTGGLKYNTSASTTLKRGTKLTILGFPLTLGANSPSSITPISSTAAVGVDGLDHGFILTSETNFESGCSGGPAFIQEQDGSYTVVGVVTATMGRNMGGIIPISKIK